MTVLIKSYNKNRVCHSINELKKALQRDYAEQSIALHNTEESGITTVVFVDVDQAGHCVDSYKRTSIDLSIFKFV